MSSGFRRLLTICENNRRERNIANQLSEVTGRPEKIHKPVIKFKNPKFHKI